MPGDSAKGGLRAIENRAGACYVNRLADIETAFSDDGGQCEERGFSVAGKGNFENQLIAAAGEEALRSAKKLLKDGELAGAWRDAAGKLHGVFAVAGSGKRVETAVATGERMEGECSECGAGVCAHAVALVMHAGRFPLHEKQEADPVYYGGLRTQTLPQLIERGRRSGAELAIQAQSAAPHVPSKWENMTLRVRLCENGRECAGNLNNLRKLYFDKSLNVIIRYEDFSLQEQQIIRFLALYGEPDGAGIALDSELTAELFHSLVGFPRFFRDGKALAIRAERAEPALLANGGRLHPGILIDGAPLPVSAAKVVAGRSGCWVGCDRDYFFVPGTCEIGFLRSFFRSSPRENPKPPADFQLPVVNIRSPEPPVLPGRVLCDGVVDGAAELLRREWSFVTVTLLGTKVTTSIYKMFENSGILVVAMVFVIIALLALAFALLVEFKLVSFKFAGFVLLGVALFALLAGIFYFCACTGDYDGCDLGIGAVLCGLLSIFAAGAAGFVGCMKVLKK